MPPGVSPSDIPGNRPEDAKLEDAFNSWCATLSDEDAARIPDECADMVFAAFMAGYELGGQ